MAAKKSKPAYEFVLEALRKNPRAEFAEVKAAADRKKLKIFPIMYGRAKKQLGLIKPKGGRKAAAKKKVAKVARKSTPVRRKVARRAAPAPRAKAAADDGLESVILAMRNNEIERERYHDALLRIKAIVDELA